MRIPAHIASPVKDQRDLLTMGSGALASLVLIGTSLTALNKNVIGFHGWPGTSREPTPSAVLPAAAPATSSTRAAFAFVDASGVVRSAALVPSAAGLPRFLAPERDPGLGSRSLTGERIPAAPVPTPTVQAPTVPVPVAPIPAAAAAVNPPVPSSVGAPPATKPPATSTSGGTKNSGKSDRSNGKGKKRKDPKQPNAGTAPAAAASSPVVAAAPVSVAASPVRTASAGPAKPRREHAPRREAAPQREHKAPRLLSSRGGKPSRPAAPTAAPTVAPAAAPAPVPTMAAGAPAVAPATPGHGAGKPGKAGKEHKSGKGR